MRFEKLLWAALAMLLSGGAGLGDTLGGAVTESGAYDAADGGSDIPPPGASGEYEAADGGSDIPPPSRP